MKTENNLKAYKARYIVAITVYEEVELKIMAVDQDDAVAQAEALNNGYYNEVMEKIKPENIIADETLKHEHFDGREELYFEEASAMEDDNNENA